MNTLASSFPVRHRTSLLSLTAGAVTGVLAAGLAAGPPATAVTSAEPAALPARPNILIINTDDQRATETLAVMPRVRSYFADGGTTFLNASVSTPLCCPSRSSLFSGRYSHNTGITGNGMPEQVAAFDQDATMQGYLQDAGYRTAIVGKYLNTFPLSRSPLNWDRWATLAGGYVDRSFNVNGRVQRYPGYYAQHMGNFATTFLDNFEATDDQPWLMYIAPQAPHSGFVPEAKYASAPVPAPVPPPSWNEDNVSDKPPPVRRATKISQTSYENTRAQQLRTLMSVDDLVGRVLDHMTALGEDQNVLAIYMSDNGYMWGEHRLTAKRFPYMESTEVPMLIRWPGVFDPDAQSTRIMTQVDLLPTLLEAAGADPTLTYPLDGRSLISGTPHDEVLLEYHKSADAALGPWAGLRTSDWQYVEWYTVDTGALKFREYYDLTKDPFQLENLLQNGVTGDEPDVAALSARLASVRACESIGCP